MTELTPDAEYRYQVECEFIAACCEYAVLYAALRKNEAGVIRMGDIVAERLRKRHGKEPSLGAIALSCSRVLSK